MGNLTYILWQLLPLTYINGPDRGWFMANLMAILHPSPALSKVDICFEKEHSRRRWRTFNIRGDGNYLVHLTLTSIGTEVIWFKRKRGLLYLKEYSSNIDSTLYNSPFFKALSMIGVIVISHTIDVAIPAEMNPSD